MSYLQWYLAVCGVAFNVALVALVADRLARRKRQAGGQFFQEPV